MLIIEAANDDEDSMVLLTVRVGSRLEEFTMRFPVSQLLFDLDRQAYINVIDALREVPEIKTEVVC